MACASRCHDFGSCFWSRILALGKHIFNNLYRQEAILDVLEVRTEALIVVPLSIRRRIFANVEIQCVKSYYPILLTEVVSRNFGRIQRIPFSFHIGLEFCLHDTILASYRIGLLLRGERFAVHCNGFTVCFL